MGSTFKKIDRKFILSDSSINVYGFRLLTDGYQIDEFLKSPIGYYMHDDGGGVLLRWDDVNIEGDNVTGFPVVNLSHPRGQQTADEIEAGFLNAASVGDIVILDYRYDDNPANPDEPTLVATKWYNKETSVVEKPGNRSAFAARLFDEKGQEINLGDLPNKTKIKNMKKVTLSITPALIGLLGLSDNGNNADETEVLNRLQNLADKAAKADALESENKTLKTDTETLKTAKETAVKDLSDFKKTAQTTEVKNLLDKALDDKKLTKELSDTLASDYGGNPEGLKKVLAGMGKYVSLADTIDNNKDEKVPEKYLNKTLLQLHTADLLDEVKSKYPALYDRVKKEHDDNKKK